MPTACPLRGYGRAGTQNDRLGKAVILSTGAPLPAQWTRRRRCRCVVVAHTYGAVEVRHAAAVEEALHLRDAGPRRDGLDERHHRAGDEDENHRREHRDREGEGAVAAVDEVERPVPPRRGEFAPAVTVIGVSASPTACPFARVEACRYSK